MAIDRIVTTVVSDDLAASRAFWVDRLGFSVAFEADWHLQLVDDHNGVVVDLSSPVGDPPS